MPLLPDADGRSISRFEEADPDDWLTDPSGWTVSVQTLVQDKGYATSLLVGTELDNSDPSEIEDTYERFSKFNGDR